MKAIDTHLHLDDTKFKSACAAVQQLSSEIVNSDISKVVLLHLETQPWSIEEVVLAAKPFEYINVFVNIHPNLPDSKNQLKRAVNELGCIGLKLHPRLQEFSLLSQNTQDLVGFAGDLDIPVLIDAFPDGTHLMQGFDPTHYSTLAKNCPNTRIIWAHMGGHHVIDFMMLAKRLPNVYMDMSYSLLYYRTSSVIVDMIYAMRSMKFNRIFYGSDYPDRSLQSSLIDSIAELRNNNVTDAQLQKLIYSNAVNFFGL